ncbi:MAG: response regulator [Pseudomonadota bacterium]
MASFLVELDDHVAAMNQALLALERCDAAEEDHAHVDALFRTAHTLKSASRAVGVSAIEAAAHRVEGVITSLRSGALPRSTGLFEALFGLADGIREAGKGLRAGQGVPATFFDGVLKHLEVVASLSPGGPAARPSKRPEPGRPRHGATQDPGIQPGTPVTVRVAPRRLDDILSLSHELGLRMARIGADLAELDGLQDDVDRVDPRGDLRRRLARVRGTLRADLASTDLAMGQLEEEVQRLRMFPFLMACQGLDRVVRDLEAEAGREADLVVSGTDIEMDRAVLEGLKAPLLHLVRNAVGHGIEPAAARVAAGKPSRGTIRVAASLLQGQVQVVVEDDGQGIDLEAVHRVARRQGLPGGADEETLLRLLLRPGFTTAGEASVLAGRGVGLDVVKTRIEELQGTLRISTSRGRGTAVSLQVPLTLTTVAVLLIADGAVCYAIPSAQVEQVLRVTPGALLHTGGRTMVQIDGVALPVAPLARMLDGGAAPAWGDGEFVPGVVLRAQGRRGVLLVEQLLETRDIQVRPLGPRLGRIRHMSGAATLSDGSVVPILYPPALLEALTGAGPEGAWAPPDDRAEGQPSARLLLVDDSLTTRSLERMILESAGYQVTTAVDGAEAWDLLQRTEVDLVVADVQMPRLDGFGLTEAIRASKRLSDLPVVLVTGLDSEEHRQRGLDAGADAYIVKSAFDQGQLLETIARLL